MIEKYTDIEKLTVPMINEYIEKVVVHEATGGRKGKKITQEKLVENINITRQYISLLEFSYFIRTRG